MKHVLKTATILSWINIVIGGFLVLAGLLGVAMTGGALMMLISVVLTGSIVLHSYATLQLRRSIVNPDVPLGNQTPVGIRMVGFIALFFAILNIGNAVVIIQNAPEVARQALLNMPLKPEGIDFVTAVKAAGIFSLIFSIGIAVNVFLSTRLLRWYLSSKQE
ncbi:MAG: hypothetical protein KF746_24585 [Chitinophagaceae bacterium]|nr:hypothetical protein [Chitinophagaceae bacterium]